MPTDREPPRDEEKAGTMGYRFTHRKITDTREESETTLTSTVGSDGFVRQESHERHASYSRSREQIEFSAGAPGETPRPISPDAELMLPSADPDLLSGPNRRLLPSGSECDAADEEPDLTR